jgi:hypothetical protein
MRVEKCCEMFIHFAGKAFTKRKGSTLPVIKHFVHISYNSQYETKGLKAVLKDAFGEQKLFFGESVNSNSEKEIKVGVTMTSSSGSPLFVGNYNRPTPEENPRLLSSVSLRVGIVTN